MLTYEERPLYHCSFSLLLIKLLSASICFVGRKISWISPVLDDMGEKTGKKGCRRLILDLKSKYNSLFYSLLAKHA